MRKITLFLVLNLFFISLISQENKIKNINDLYLFLENENQEKTLSTSELKKLHRDFSFLSTRFDNSGRIKGYQNALYNYYTFDKNTEQKSFVIENQISQLNWNYIGPKGLHSNNPDNHSKWAIGRG